MTPERQQTPAPTPMLFNERCNWCGTLIQQTPTPLLVYCSEACARAWEAAHTEPGHSPRWLQERYWCGCIREARWVPRCEMHRELDHDEEPPAQEPPEAAAVDPVSAANGFLVYPPAVKALTEPTPPTPVAEETVPLTVYEDMVREYAAKVEKQATDFLETHDRDVLTWRRLRDAVNEYDYLRRDCPDEATRDAGWANVMRAMGYNVATPEPPEADAVDRSRSSPTASAVSTYTATRGAGAEP